MPNRENLHIPATRAHRGGESDAAAWVFVAFCAAGFAATIFFISLSSHIGQTAVILTSQG